jgi:hypothetical protein
MRRKSSGIPVELLPIRPGLADAAFRQIHSWPLKTALGDLEESAARFEYCKFYVNQRGLEVAIDAIQEVQVSLDEM